MGTAPPGQDMSTADDGNHDGNQKVVLLVEDDEDARDLLATILEDAHYKVVRAGNGAEALTLLQDLKDGCNIILLDLMMPVMNGWDFRRKQKQNAELAGIPVLLMSAGARIASASGDLDAAGYLTKPVEIPDLLEKVKRHCC
jgi:two-component system chemotaxis response regulator CheY